MVSKLDELTKQNTFIDRRVRAKEFMLLLSIEKDKFYGLVDAGEIEQPIRLSKHDVFWYASYVKKKVEEHKSESVIVAHI
ncbi:helix-turn-helix transcriptional regulator [Acinetobacter proteolyticus]|nr:transcriptional regulator [Acinetobacter proteolyticus]